MSRSPTTQSRSGEARVHVRGGSGSVSVEWCAVVWASEVCGVGCGARVYR